MIYITKLRKSLIQWLKFDPENPVCEFDPRTGEHHKWVNRGIYNKKCSDKLEEERKKYGYGSSTATLHCIAEIITIFFHYSCQRVYYIIKNKKFKIGLEDYYKY